MTFIVVLLLAVFAEPLIGLLPAELGLAWLSSLLQRGIISLALFAGAHVVYLPALNRLVEWREGRRRVPKVALDLLRVFLFRPRDAYQPVADLPAGPLVHLDRVLAVLGFAVRNVVADVFSGLALGLEAPFRIGDWVRIETLGQGRGEEIG